VFQIAALAFRDCTYEQDFRIAEPSGTLGVNGG